MRERRGAYRVWRGKLIGGDYLEDPGVDGTIILKWILTTCDRGMGLIDLAQDRKRWRALMNAVKDLRVLQNAGNLLTR
jgi:hypothetical protein